MLVTTGWNINTVAVVLMQGRRSESLLSLLPYFLC